MKKALLAAALAAVVAGLILAAPSGAWVVAGTFVAGLIWLALREAWR